MHHLYQHNAVIILKLLLARKFNVMLYLQTVSLCYAQHYWNAGCKNYPMSQKTGHPTFAHNFDKC